MKNYHINSEHGQKEQFGEYSLFDNIGKFTTGFVLKSYSFDKVNNKDEDIFCKGRELLSNSVPAIYF